jgi:hypothetical protein
MRFGLANCYDRLRQQNPLAEGCLVLWITVGPAGGPEDAMVAASGELDPAVHCVEQRAHAVWFDPPRGGRAALQVVVTFERPSPGGPQWNRVHGQ